MLHVSLGGSRVGGALNAHARSRLFRAWGGATQAPYEGFVRASGLGFTSPEITGDPHRLVSALLCAGTNPCGFARRFGHIRVKEGQLGA